MRYDANKIRTSTLLLAVMATLLLLNAIVPPSSVLAEETASDVTEAAPFIVKDGEVIGGNDAEVVRVDSYVDEEGNVVTLDAPAFCKSYISEPSDTVSTNTIYYIVGGVLFLAVLVAIVFRRVIDSDKRVK